MCLVLSLLGLIIERYMFINIGVRSVILYGEEGSRCSIRLYRYTYESTGERTHSWTSARASESTTSIPNFKVSLWNTYLLKNDGILLIDVNKRRMYLTSIGSQNTGSCMLASRQAKTSFPVESKILPMESWKKITDKEKIRPYWTGRPRSPGKLEMTKTDC